MRNPLPAYILLSVFRSAGPTSIITIHHARSELVMRCRFIVFVVVASLTGCEVDAIHSREVPKLPLVAQRTLAVLVPRDDATWFFKISGPESAVRADQTAFDGFVGSVTFAEGDKPVRWTLPDGWRLDPGGKSRSKMIQRYATLRTSNGNEILITRLGAEPGTRELLGNVNRWRARLAWARWRKANCPQCPRCWPSPE